MRKPKRRPRRIISIDAGKTDSMTPRCCIVTGRFAHMRISGGTIVSTASADEANISVLLLCVSAWQKPSSPMLRSARRGMPDRLRLRFLDLDCSIHWARNIVAEVGRNHP